VMGSSLPHLKENECLLGSNKYWYDGQAKDVNAFADKNLLIENAHMFLNTPYLWGGRSPFGIDCSGFTQIIYKLSGIKLRRDAFQQAEQGMTLNFIEEAELGDLAFFDNAEGTIIHVGIILPGNKIIHAAGRVRIDKIDHHGIFNVDTKKYSHKLRLIKRIM
jgi:cell wall-associated NlpC family hydrolase